MRCADCAEKRAIFFARLLTGQGNLVSWFPSSWAASATLLTSAAARTATTASMAPTASASPEAPTAPTCLPAWTASPSRLVKNGFEFGKLRHA